MREYELEFKGYYREVDKAYLPKSAGIYCVYSCKYNAITDKLNDLTLLYIGESENICERHENNKHEHYEDFKSFLHIGETLCYSYVLVPDSENRKRCESALIYKMQPPINDQSTEGFHYPKTHIITFGCNYGLNKDFTVE